MSLDGKINSGAGNNLDVDRDWPLITGVKEGLHQYYEIEEHTDLYSLNSGKVMEKIGVNDRKDHKDKMAVSFVIVDRKPHLHASGIEYLCNWVNKLILVTDNKEHPAFDLQNRFKNLFILYYIDGIILSKMLADLKESYHIERLTIQSGGTLNCEFLRENLIDYVNVVIAPLLVGGRETNTLIDGESITKQEELDKLKAMKLLECEQLQDSYLRLKYEVIK
jgi:2,5-diamino-6-(ribosylamino)-4(3H)-pyrimidinone 5'-phosphate reductase